MTRPLFDSLAVIQERLSHASHLVIGLDYDGTLTPLVDDPNQATLDAKTRAIVAALASRPNTSVAIVSGRRLHDVRNLVGMDGLIYAGNHGFEICGPQMTFLEPNAAKMQQTLARLATDLARSLGEVDGAIVEYKALTISVHCRRVAPAQRESVFRHIHAAASIMPNLFRIGVGNLVFEVCPRVDWHKGAAMRWIADRLHKQHGLMIYIGDDLTDEDAFRALSEGVTVKVGEPRGTAANYYLDGPASVHNFLEWLAAMGKSGGPTG